MLHRTTGTRYRAGRFAKCPMRAVTTLVATIVAFILVPLLLLLPAVSSAQPARRSLLMAVDYQSQCINDDVLPNLGAQPNPVDNSAPRILRVGISPDRVGQGLDCVAAAVRQGYKVYISIQYWNYWNLSSIVNWFATELPQYQAAAGPAGLWAVSIGNEQDLEQPMTFPAPSGDNSICKTTRAIRGGRLVATSACSPSSAGDDYRLVWNAVEPVVKAIAPHAILVYGDVSPWSFGSYLTDGWTDFSQTPPGVGAIGIHCYRATDDGTTDDGGLYSVPGIATWAAMKHVPVWCSEMAPWQWDQGCWNSVSHWADEVADVVGKAPNLQMVSYYDLHPYVCPT